MGVHPLQLVAASRACFAGYAGFLWKLLEPVPASPAPDVLKDVITGLGLQCVIRNSPLLSPVLCPAATDHRSLTCSLSGSF